MKKLTVQLLVTFNVEVLSDVPSEDAVAETLAENLVHLLDDTDLGSRSLCKASVQDVDVYNVEDAK